MATDITDWMPDVLPFVVGAPVPAIELAVRNAAIEFCERTLLWVKTLDRISVVADTRSYDLTLDATLYAETVMAETVKYKQDGQDDDQFTKLNPISDVQIDLDPGVPGAWSHWTSPTPSHFWVDNEDKQIHLYMIPTEDSASGLLVSLSIKPDATTTTLPDFLRRDYRTVIADGALNDLFLRSSTPWYDRAAGIDYRMRFDMGMNNALNKKISGATKRTSRVRMRSY